MKKQTTSKNNSDIFTELFEDWIKYKKEAIDKEDYDFYYFFLKEIQMAFSELYAQSTMKEALDLEEIILKQVSKEMKWVNNKRQEKEIPF